MKEFKKGEGAFMDAMRMKGMTHTEMLNERMAEDYYWKMIEDNECRPVDVTKDVGRWKSGYIDRRGDFYPCPMIQHASLGTMMQEYGIIPNDVEDTDKWCDKNNWVKISINRILFYGTRKPTRSQYATIYKYFETRDLSKIKLNMESIDICELELKIEDGLR